MVEPWSLGPSHWKSPSYWSEKISLNCQIYHVEDNINENALTKHRKEKFKPACLKSQGQGQWKRK